VAPGFFPNNNPAQMLFNPDGSYRAKAQRVDATPMHRMGHPNELIGTLVWLASDASSYVTGITVTVDGGYLLDSPA
jgi:NAD(P)-dependent dehydrogenase (short-subunit alcohol dehydrogenase family)